MTKFSEILVANLNEMEFLTKTLASAQIYYAEIDPALAKIVKQSQFCLLNATLDLALDLDHKIHHQIDKSHLAQQIVRNLDEAAKILSSFPHQNKVANFNEIEVEILFLLDFAKEYAIGGYQIVAEFSAQEKQLLTNKILIIKSRRTI